MRVQTGYSTQTEIPDDATLIWSDIILVPGGAALISFSEDRSGKGFTLAKVLLEDGRSDYRCSSASSFGDSNEFTIETARLCVQGAMGELGIRSYLLPSNDQKSLLKSLSAKRTPKKISKAGR